MVKDLSEKALKELIDEALLDNSIPTYARTLIQILAQQQEILRKEHQVLKRVLGPKYERALRKDMEEDGDSDLLSWTAFFMLLFFVLYVIRQWIKGARFTEKVKVNGKVAIVTGANCGIGKQIVRELVLRGAKVYIMCRNVELGKEAVRDLFSRYGCDSTRMIVKYGDLNDFDSIRRFVNEFNREEEVLDILINNAGVMFRPKFELTKDNHEVTWQSNHLGHFLLTELLLPKLRKSQGARIVIHSSKLHLNADTIDPDVVDSKKHWGRISSYNRSKLAN
uniref:Uncharacterized protein n=1 Tax=Acrobeloides nanus TaxID=290746 RepID=A0A914CW33_9BILA